MKRNDRRGRVGIIRLGIAGAVLALAGCATPGVVQLAPDHYRLTLREVGSAWDDTNFKERAISQAMRFAGEKGKVAVPLGIAESDYGLFVDWVRVDYEFKLVDRNDPRSTQTSANSPGQGAYVYDELAKLGELRKKGILTQAEFETEKKRLLAR